MKTETPDLLTELLMGAIEQLDIPRQVFETLVGRYDHLAQWLRGRGLSVSAEIYPQGSMRLGTPVQPDTASLDFDIDMVLLLTVAKEDISKVDLRDEVGVLLADYAKAHGSEMSVSGIDEKGRCWTLEYDGLGFHLDVLPAIPDAAAVSDSAILLTDRDLHHWQESDPIRYAEWFLVERTPWEVTVRASAELATRLDVSVENVPRFLVRTPLQRAVQVAKRHRDVHFRSSPQLRPPSVLITTLIAMGYEGETSLREILERFLEVAPDLVESRDGIWWVPNPVAEGENFADKWNSHPERRAAFWEWVEALQSDLEHASSSLGFDAVAASLGRSFGEEPVRAAATAIGKSFGGSAAVAGPAIGSAGQLIRSKPKRPAPHTFHGPTRE